MEHQKKQNHQDSRLLAFDPIVVVQDVLKHWLVIVLAALLVGVGTYIRADLRYAPTYSTTTTYVVTTRGSSSTVYNNLTTTTNLASVFQELLNSSLLRKTVLAKTGSASFDGTITASVISNTNLINVTVSASDPRTAFTVAQAIVDYHEEVTYQVVSSTTLEVLRAPSVPMAPVNQSNAMEQMKKMAVLAAGAAAAALAALSFFRKAVRSEYEAGKVLTCDCLGEIPHERKRRSLLARLKRRKASILVTNSATSFRFVETIRKLRRRVERMMHGRKVIMVTSLLENEGKSTVAVNLALSLSQKHARVLLIDCDLRKPACHSILDQADIPVQLCDVLSGKSSFRDAVICDRMSSLHLLLEKRAVRNSGDMISSAAMQALLDQARREYDYVVLDLPPMAVVSDAESMMEFADASLLVVRQNIATAPAVNKAVTALSGGKAKLLGCVVNNVYSTGLTLGQGYSNSYRHSGYGHYGSKKSK